MRVSERSLPPIGKREMRVILDEIRRGVSVVVGSSRNHDEYSYENGQFIRQDFDEGETHDQVINARRMRAAVRCNPERFRPLLSRPVRRAFIVAYASGLRDQAREQLRRWAALGGDEDDILVFDTLLAWPEEQPSAEAYEIIAEKFRSHTMFHLFMDAVLWERSATNGALGVGFIDALAELVDEVPMFFDARASFKELAGDLEGAVADLDQELARLEAGSWDYERVQSQRERLAQQVSRC